MMVSCVEDTFDRISMQAAQCVPWYIARYTRQRRADKGQDARFSSIRLHWLHCSILTVLWHQEMLQVMMALCCIKWRAVLCCAALLRAQTLVNPARHELAWLCELSRISSCAGRHDASSVCLQGEPALPAERLAFHQHPPPGSFWRCRFLNYCLSG